MKKAILKIILALAPFVCLSVFYVVKDPFFIIWHYDNLNTPNVNRDYLSTETFVRNYQKYKYDSYIFGSSRSENYLVEDWQKHIKYRACFHFSSSEESLWGIERKINFLHKRGVTINNALIIVDEGLLAKTANSEGHIFRKDPLVSGESEFFYQLCYFEDFWDAGFIYNQIKSSLTKVKNENTVNTDYWGVEEFVDSSNQLTLKIFEQQIAHNRDSFYNARLEYFLKRDTDSKTSPQGIGTAQLKLLKSIKDNLGTTTNYRIVISPMYDQVKFNPRDLEILDSMFGKQNVFDFSGVNEITNDLHNYYEFSHYRPFIAARIMDSIYKK